MITRERMIDDLVRFQLEGFESGDRRWQQEQVEHWMRAGFVGYQNQSDSEIEAEWGFGPGENIPVEPPFVFSWRDYAIVKTHGGYRVNIMDVVYPTIERCIEVIESDIERYEEGGLTWHRDENTDLVCVVHNCLYWQCACGKETGDIRLHKPVVKSHDARLD